MKGEVSLHETKEFKRVVHDPTLIVDMYECGRNTF